MARLHTALLLILTLFTARSAFALIMVGGKDPVTDHNWPAGTLDVANHKSRLSYYEGPPFGGGQYVFQHLGNTAVFADVLSKFATIKSPGLTLIVHDGTGRNHVATQQEKAAGTDRRDFTFTVWSPESFYQLFATTNTFMSDQPEWHAEMPSPILAVWVGEGGIDWSKIAVPAGIRVVDERAIGHGYTVDDGAVVTGTVYDMASSKPVAGAELVLERYGDLPNSQNSAEDNQPAKGYSKAASVVGDADGRFELKKIAAGSYQASVRCAGYASRKIGYILLEKGSYKEFTVKILPTIEQMGKVVDVAGKPVAKANVRIDSVLAMDGRGYPQTREKTILTDDEGNFVLTDLPTGQSRITVWAVKLYQIDSMKMHSLPMKNLKLTMTASGGITIKVVSQNGDAVSKGNVSIWEQKGEKVGSWGGGAELKEDGTYTFDAVPPGKYFISADAGSKYNGNKGATPVEIKAGQILEVEIRK